MSSVFVRLSLSASSSGEPQVDSHKHWRCIPATIVRYNIPMKYSLRSLMIVVTLVAVVLGGRVEYLRRMAAYHEGESSKSGDPQKVLNHAHAAGQFRQAMLRPWTIVDDSPRHFPIR